jgi:hypothetical protein
VIGEWQTPEFSNGNSHEGSPVQFRLESGNVCRLIGVFEFAASDGNSEILGLPIPLSEYCHFIMGGSGAPSLSEADPMGSQTYPQAAWKVSLNQVGSLSFYIIAPTGAKSGGLCGLSGITYVHV